MAASVLLGLESEVRLPFLYMTAFTIPYQLFSHAKTKLISQSLSTFGT